MPFPLPTFDALATTDAAIDVPQTYKTAGGFVAVDAWSAKFAARELRLIRRGNFKREF